ncbi:MAG: hypothetical protein LCH58_05525 [Bacteroidetes bacterium]|uniref:hypothetical protein n=1 Tax=Phnomibacter sp. TaxID=2836217 RepID=UPI002FDEDE60|nr:hypothetical protein [Bacteroidota bacterium]
MKLLIRYIFTLQLLMLILNSHAQNAAARYEIDAKRMGVSPTEKDALPRGKEFVRLDSTYYVGWMFQGMYLHDRSADVSGLQKALPILRKSFYLIEKDYGGLLATIYNDPYTYTVNNLRYADYLNIAGALREVYENLEMPDSAWWVIQRVQTKDFRKDHYSLLYSRMSWLVHRNRFYTKKQFAFLRNSVAENEQLALQLCYDGLGFIDRNKPNNDLWFGDYQSIPDKLSIYHNLSLIHSYLKNYDSSAYYYEQLAANGSVSWNNYGSLKTEMGEFAAATEMYNRDKYKYGGIKYLMEPYYYLPTLQIYAGKTVAAMDIAREAIQYSNSSPGFGWYNIALARSYLYNGQLDSAWLTLDKAAHFKEIHIGTTLTQPQYEFTIGVLKLIWFEKQIAATKFLHPNWWYHPKWLYEVASLQAQQYVHEYLLANQLILNPERSRIIYDLFCGESTVSYDEVFSLMHRFSPRYFGKLMHEYASLDPREKIKPYFKLYEGRLLWTQKKYQQAADTYKTLTSAVVDTAHEKLFMARLYEGLWEQAVRDNDEAKAIQFQQLLFEHYPTLIPFSNLPFSMQVQFSGLADKVTNQVQADIRQCNITSNDNSSIPKAVVQFSKKGSKYSANIDVYNQKGIILFSRKLLFSTAENVGAQIAFSFFGTEIPLEIDAPATQEATTTP